METTPKRSLEDGCSSSFGQVPPREEDSFGREDEVLAPRRWVLSDYQSFCFGLAGLEVGFLSLGIAPPLLQVLLWGSSTVLLALAWSLFVLRLQGTRAASGGSIRTLDGLQLLGTAVWFLLWL